jgi:hypothetical protein
MTEAEELRAADWWKHAPGEQPSRALLQARIDRQYATGMIDLDEWLRGTEHLSTCDARGKVMALVIGRRAT